MNKIEFKDLYGLLNQIYFSDMICSIYDKKKIEAKLRFTFSLRTCRYDTSGINRSRDAISDNAYSTIL